MGPPAAPRLGGRRPRRRLCFPPPPEGCRGPAFIFLFILTWLPGLIVSSSPRLAHAVGAGCCASSNDKAHAKTLGCYRERYSNRLGALELCAKGQPRSVAVGNILMLPTKASDAQGGNIHSFAQTEPFGNGWGPLASLCEGIASIHISAGIALLKPLHALLRGAVRKRIGIHVSTRHAL